MSDNDSDYLEEAKNFWRNGDSALHGSFAQAAALIAIAEELRKLNQVHEPREIKINLTGDIGKGISDRQKIRLAGLFR